MIPVSHQSVIIHVNEYNELIHEKALLEKQLDELSELKPIEIDKLQKIINDSDKNILVLTKHREIRTARYEYTHQFYDREFLNTFIEVKSLSEAFSEEISDYICSLIFKKLIEDKKIFYCVKEKIKEKIGNDNIYENIKDEVKSEIDKLIFEPDKGKWHCNISSDACNLIRKIFKKQNNE